MAAFLQTCLCLFAHLSTSFAYILRPGSALHAQDSSLRLAGSLLRPSRFNDDAWYDSVSRMAESFFAPGSWTVDAHFTSDFLRARPAVDFREELRHRRIFFVGDSWGREQYKAMVNLLTPPGNRSRLPPRYESCAEGDQQGHRCMTGESMRSCAPGTCDRPECKPRSCGPGLDLELCGRPGTDEWHDLERNVTLHFQFKTYFYTPATDALLFADIRSFAPDVLFVNIGRWAYTPMGCSLGSPLFQLPQFISDLNGTTACPILWVSSQVLHSWGTCENDFTPSCGRSAPDLNWTQGCDAGWYCRGDPEGQLWDVAHELMTGDEYRFVRINAAGMLSTSIVNSFFEQATPWPADRPPLYVGHGYAGPFLNELTRLLLSFIASTPL